MIIQVSRQAVSSPSWVLLVFWHMVDFWARLKKTLSFVSGEQINKLLFAKLKADANNYWSTSHWQKSWCFPITKFNNWFIIQSPFFWSSKCVRSLSACLGNWSAFFTQEHSFNTHEQNIICSKTLICTQLLAVHVVSSQPMKRKEKLYIEWWFFIEARREFFKWYKSKNQSK